MTGTPVGHRPRLFVAVAITHALLAGGFAVMSGALVIFLMGHELGILESLGFGFFLAFILLIVVLFTAQTVNAITLLTRRGDDRGTVKFTRFIEVIPYPTTRWSAFWVRVQRDPWQHPVGLGIYLLAVTGIVFAVNLIVHAQPT